MSLNRECYDLLRNEIKSNYQTEIKYYARKDVATTSQAVGVVDKGSWTQLFFEAKLIDSLPEKGDRFTELERTLTGFYCLLLQEFPDEAYQAFTAVQEEKNDKLSQKNFQEIFSRTQTIIGKDLDKQAVLMRLIIYSDLGKSAYFKTKVADLAKKNNISINTSSDPDDLMSAIFEKFDDDQISEILPSFHKLSDSAKKILKEYYPIMQACFGHLYFLERGKKTLQVIGVALEKIPLERRKEALDLVYLAQFYDAVGAQGQQRMAGSITCTNNFARGYGLIYTYLHVFRSLLTETENVDASAQTIFNDYLHQRAQWLGFATAENFLSVEVQLLTRLGCMIRGFTSEFGEILQQEFKKLSAQHKKLLIDQFGFHQDGLEGWTKVNYIATLLQNLSLEFFMKGDLATAISRALDGAICFAMLVKKMTIEFPDIIYDENRSISFGEVAFLSKEPKLFNPKTFPVTDFVLDPQQNKITKIAHRNNFQSRAIITSFSLAGLYVGFTLFNARKTPSAVSSVGPVLQHTIRK